MRNPAPTPPKGMGIKPGPIPNPPKPPPPKGSTVSLERMIWEDEWSPDILDVGLVWCSKELLSDILVGLLCSNEPVSDKGRGLVMATTRARNAAVRNTTAS